MTIGPFSFAPGVVLALLAVFAALGVGNAVARRAGARAEGLLWYCALAALLAGRGVFVARWWPAYADAPLQIINLRDGGFHALAAGAAVIVAGGLLAWRRPAQRRALLAGLATAFVVWGCGTAWWASREDTRALPALTLAAPDGRTVDLARLAGQPVVLNLWATWCPPCRREMPVLARAQRDYPDVRFVFVNQGEDAATVAAYLRAQGLRIDGLLLDPAGSLARTTGSPGLPTTLFFDVRGRLAERRIGEVSAATLAAALGPLRVGATSP